MSKSEIKKQYDSLHDAAKDGNIKAIKYFISNGVDVNLKDEEYESSPLHYASEKGEVEAVKALIEIGADVNLKDCDKRTPLHEASRNGWVEVMNILISNGADINAIDEDGFTALKYAEDDGNEEVVKYMKNLQRKVSEFTKECAKSYHPSNTVREETVIISSGGWRATHKNYILTNDDGEDKSISKEEYDEFNNKKDKTKIICDLLTNLNKLKTLL